MYPYLCATSFLVVLLVLQKVSIISELTVTVTVDLGACDLRVYSLSGTCWYISRIGYRPRI